MSFSIDTNILIYSVNPSCEQFKKAKSFVENVANSDDTWVMPWPVIHSFIRLTTHQAIMPNPLSTSSAVDIIDLILKMPNIKLISENENFWDSFKKEILTGHVKGSAISDSVLATILKENSVRLFYSADRDFMKFKHLRIVNPLETK